MGSLGPGPGMLWCDSHLQPALKPPTLSAPVPTASPSPWLPRPLPPTPQRPAPQHVVKVLPSSEETQLDRQRMMLRLAPDGRVVWVSPGAGRALFGFNPRVGGGEGCA
jgi:hypothetical protein